MFYILECSNCSLNLRVPLDQGTLSVTCPRCQHSFSFDPNNPETYQKGGKFDIKEDYKSSGNSVYTLFNFFLDFLKSLRPNFSVLLNEKDFSKKLAKAILYFLLLLGIFRFCGFFQNPINKTGDWEDNQDNLYDQEEDSPGPSQQPLETEDKPEYEI